MPVRALTLLLLFAAANAAGQIDPEKGTGPGNPLVKEGDRWYSRRQEGRNGSRAANGPIAQAIAKYEEAARAPDQLEARWKLARALYFKGPSGESIEFVMTDEFVPVPEGQ